VFRGSLRTISKAVVFLKTAFAFKYPDFKLDAHCGAKLDNLVATLVKEGKLLRGTWRACQHVALQILRKIIVVNVSLALIEGVRSWVSGRLEH